ncbi:MAG: HAD family hydrolase [Phormidium sp. GEM2.Bin31]|nr:MAG: HAD family hydrolase [Phormidium sp. GEM2.Bin31]
MNLNHYQTLIFDCDGVILNSNQVKTQAFYKATLSYGEAAAESLVNYHIQHGGISRYHKFEVFLNELIPPGITGANLDELLALYAQEVRRGLLTCEVADGLTELRQHTASSRWLIVSGGDQNELRDIFRQRGLDALFDGGIFGSPDRKEQILHRELYHGNIKQPALFLGDSQYDSQAARATGLDFMFISGWTEFKGWQKYCSEHNLPHIKTLAHLL